MKEITVENFDYSNVRKWIADYSHKEKVEFAVYCAELVVDLYAGTNDAPKKAIQAAKDWILNPSKENKEKCKAAAYAAAADAAAAYAADAAAAYAADAAADAAAAAAAAADAAAAAAAAAAYAADDAAAAYAADAAAAAAAAAAAYAADDAAATAGRSIKGKIINYIKSKLVPQTKEVEWENGLPPVGEKVVLRYMFDSKTVCHCGYVLYASESNCLLDINGKDCHFKIGDYQYEKPETPEAKKEREELEALVLFIEKANSSMPDFHDKSSDHWVATCLINAGYRKEK